MRGKLSLFSALSIAIISTSTLSFLVFGLVCILPAKADLSASSGDSWAIIAGVQDYKYASDLAYCDDDAIELYNLIAPTWGASHVKLLVDANATKAGINDALYNWLAPAEDQDDTVLFFFSGHGRRATDVDPLDEVDGKDEYICPQDALTSSTTNDIRDDELDTWLSTLNSGRIVVILDTCFSGGFISSSMGMNTIEIDKTAATEDNSKLGDSNDDFVKDISKSGRVILAASAETEESWMYGELAQGVFSYYVIEALSRLDAVDANANNEISAEEIFSYAEPRTVDCVERHGDEQHPKLYDGYAGDLPLIMTTTTTFDSSPRGVLMTIDGAAYSPSQMPRTFKWARNTTHAFNVSSYAYEVETDNVALESAHPYSNNTSYTWPALNHTGATSVRVHFNYILTEGGYDRVYVLDGAGRVCASYSGQFYDLWSVWVPGSTIKVRLSSDGSVCYNGFALDGLDWEDQTTRHAFNSWNDGNTSTSRTLIASAPQTYTATYGTEYYLTVASAYGSKGGEGWYTNGTTAYATLAAGTVDHGNGTRRVFVNWSGDATGTNYTACSPVFMNASKAVTANWKTQYYFNVSSAYGATTGTGWYDRNTYANAAVTSTTVPGATGTQYVFTYWSGTASGTNPTSNPILMNGPNTATANWKTQYYLSVSSAYGTTAGAGWYDSGYSTYVTVTPTTVLGTTGTRYIFTNWTGAVNSTSPSSPTIVMNMAKAMTANWKTQYYLDVSSPYGTTSGGGWYDRNTFANAAVSQTTVSGATGVRYVFTSWSGAASGSTSTSNPILMDSAKNAQANWKTQYFITVNSGHSAPTSSQWVDGGAAFTASVSSPTEIVAGNRQWICTGYSIDGGASQSGTNYTFNNIQAPSTVTFNWKQQFYLTVNSAHGTSSGTGWYDSGSIANAVLSNGTIPSGIGAQYAFSGWGGDASGNSLTSNGITMNSAKTATANWKTQYYLNATSPYGTVTGSGWYDSGTSANAVLASGTVSGGTGTQYVFTGWGGDASGTGLTSNNIIMNNPKAATASWKTQCRVSFALNPTGAGTISPSADTWVDAGGSPLSISASASSGYTFTSWSATPGINIANPQASGTTASVTAAGTITANFAAQPQSSSSSSSSTSEEPSSPPSSPPSQAQAKTGDLIVCVKDANNNPIEGVTIVTTSQPEGQNVLSATTNSSGYVTFSNVKAGSYSLQASKNGYIMNTEQATAQTDKATQVTIELQNEIISPPPQPTDWTVVAIIVVAVAAVSAIIVFFVKRKKNR